MSNDTTETPTPKGAEYANSLAPTSAPAEETPATPEAAPAVPNDSLRSKAFPNGRPWDPAKFRTNLDGTPQRDAAGRFVPLGLGRRRSDGTPPQAKTPDDSAPNFDDVRAALKEKVETTAGEMAATNTTPTAETIIGIIQTALILIGEEEGILSDGEKLLLRSPLNRVLAKYQVGADVMPCEIDLALAVVGLIVTRLKKPKTATAFAKVKAWAVEFIFRRRGAAIQRVVQTENPEVQP